MALDCQTLQTLARSQPRHTDDYCPECGRAWQAPPATRSGRAESVGWWPWLLVAAGMYLLVAYGPRAWSSAAVPGIKPAARPVVSCWMGGAGRYYEDCDPTKAGVGAVLGLAWGVVGLGALARRVVVQKRPRRRTGCWAVVDSWGGNPNRGAGLAPGMWALAETTCRYLFAPLVILVGYGGLTRLVEGLPPSGALVTQAIDRAIGVVSLALLSLP